MAVSKPENKKIVQSVVVKFYGGKNQNKRVDKDFRNGDYSFKQGSQCWSIKITFEQRIGGSKEARELCRGEECFRQREQPMQSP